MSQKLARVPIRRLPDSLANQIAAGEVIERPASVVKELIENSLDAEADAIEIDLDKGGMQRIDVVDNGSGIAREELALAVAAHATSKLHDTDTLMRIATLGFRGEALASICAVSRWCLISCEPQAQAAWQLCHDQPQPRPASHPEGTRMQVAELFHNLPARRKFLRTAQTEYRHVDNVFRRLALSHFEVGFTLRHNGRVSHKLSAARDAAGRERRLRKLCGKAFLDNAVWLDLDWQGMKLNGWLGQAAYSRPQGDVQYFFINGRMIKDRVINHAVRQAYQSNLYPGRFPAYVLYLEIPFDEVDVNVHPTKHEVRFRQARQVHDFLSRALREALYPDPHSQLLSQLPIYRDAYHRPAPKPDAQGAAIAGLAEGGEPYAVAAQRAPESDRRARPWGACLQILFQRFALFEQEGAYWLVDLQRARQTLARQRLREGLQGDGVESRPLLIPARLSVTAQQMQSLNRHTVLLRRLGIDCSACGPASLLLRGIPAVIAEHPQAQDVLAELLAALSRLGGDEAALTDVITDFAAGDGGVQNREAAQRLLNDIAARQIPSEGFARRLHETDMAQLMQRPRG